MARDCLVNVFAAHNMLPAAAAVRHFGNQAAAGQAANVTLLLHVPGWTREQLGQIEHLVQRQAASQGWLRVISLTESEMQAVVGDSSDPFSASAQERFRSLIGFGPAEVTEVYFSHDVVGHAAQLSMRSYPSATAITYGESMGLMEDKDYIIASVTGAGWDESKAALRPKKFPRATKAVLILPADQTGDCLDGMELLVVPRELALDVISDFQRALPELVSYSKSLLAGKKDPIFVFVVNNLADAGFLSADKEADMYAEMVRTYCPPGSTVIIKGHPLAVKPVDKLLVARLERDFQALAVDPVYSRYPMEIWHDLLAASQLISLSYCSISVEYLYRKPVIYSINTDIIYKYLEPRTWNRLTDGDEFFRKQREALKSWDGRGLLCAGKRISFAPSKLKQLESKHNHALAEQLNQQGIAMFQSGNHAEAARLFSQGMVSSPLNTAIISNLATALWHLGNRNEAAAYFLTANSINPGDRNVLLSCIQVLATVGLKQAAGSLCFRYLSSHPEDREVCDLLEKICS